MQAWWKVLVLALLVSGCAATPVPPAWTERGGLDHPELGKIVDLRSGQTLDPQALLARLSAAERVLIGERHDNADHHQLQGWLIAQLAERRGRATVLLEMLNPDQQAKVDAVTRAYAAGQPPQVLAQALAWQDGWDWSLYGPLVTGLLAQGTPLRAANLDRDEMRRLYRQPPTLNGSHASAPAVRQTLAEFIERAHCGLLPDAQLPAMLAIQQQRDRRMAEQLLATPQPAVLLAGAFHVRRDLGVPLHLRDLGAAAEPRVLLLAEVGEQVDATQADFVWFTAKAPEVDHCAQLRSHKP